MKAPVTEDRPEADRLDGAPHPRETAVLQGHAAAEQTFLDAFNSGRLHHAWLITGPQGVGKATLAWKIARFLLAAPVAGDDLLAGGDTPAPADSLDLPADHPIARRVRALSEPRLFLLRRPYDDKAKRLKQDITVDAARGMKGFFTMSAVEGGRRVVIIDSADELNTSAANAVLKLLEEPPKNAVLLLISHQPSRLLPTIRSRCRTLRCGPLTPADLAIAVEQAGLDAPDAGGALAALAAGSVGAAISLMHEDGVKLYADLMALFDGLPQIDRSRAIKLADSCAGRGSEARCDLTLALIDLFLARLARTGVAGPPTPEASPTEAALMVRLCPDPGSARHWAALHDELGTRARHGRAVNLDPAALILDTLMRINGAAAARAVPQT
ncbi:MAG: DNA polymerase III subunit delta' [Celeribacter sp.]|jgi:DNA polymerase-3 subunit delta'